MCVCRKCACMSVLCVYVCMYVYVVCDMCACVCIHVGCVSVWYLMVLGT